MTSRANGVFIAQVDDEPWAPGDPVGLPQGLEWRLYESSESGDLVALARFPPGYVEPRHVHEAEHFDVIVDGEMHVDGHVLRRGDYIRGYKNVPHGPMAYPKGVTVFAVVKGGSAVHEWGPEHIEDDSRTDGALVAHVDDEPWAPAEGIGLPAGAECRVFDSSDDGKVAVLLRFPPGYVEPLHAHDDAHYDGIVDGEVHVDGRVLRRGDYLYAPPGVPHGPLESPTGCTFFRLIEGGSKVPANDP
jgi:quercetin dioxygenase-like cupin family protein